MMTIKGYAKKKKISERTAQKHLDEQVDLGFMDRKRGPSNVYLYYKKTPTFIRWHDPFNRTLQYEMARSIQAVPETKDETVEKPKKVSKPKALALDAKAIAHTASLQYWFKNVRGSGDYANHSEHPA